MHNQKTGFYAGSFDPITRGHWALICEGLCFCDNIIIGIGINPLKTSLFSVEERIELIQSTIQDFLNNPQLIQEKSEQITHQKLTENPTCISVMAYDGLTVDAALKSNATTLIRGERNTMDREYESDLNVLNQILLKTRNKKLENLILVPQNKDRIKHISSSATKMLCNLGEYVAIHELVFPTVHNAICEKYIFPTFEKCLNFFKITDTNEIHNLYQDLKNSTPIKYPYSHIGELLNHLHIYETLEHPLSETEKQQIIGLIFQTIYHSNKTLTNNPLNHIKNEALQNLLIQLEKKVSVSVSDYL
ncbi:MAG: adenylyltransferase/cytidyltransferase family protein [Alphaproteobacteria bacterium]|nr:adenylyltransferase/cytidyltransferase family protein [Alphaproteobacteria bacterium]